MVLLLFVGCNGTPPVNHVPTINSTPTITATVGALYTYDVNATIGDIIEVSTFCNQGGTRNKQITVGSEDSSSTPGFGVLILLCSIIALMFLKKEKMGGFR